MFARAVAVVADPIAIARALADRPGLALLHTASAADGAARVSYVACDPDGETNALDPLEGRPARVASAAELGQVPAFVGTLPYEAFRPLERPRWSPPDERPRALLEAPRWRSYPAVVRVDHDRGEILAVGTSHGAVDDLARRAARPSVAGPEPSISARFTDADEVHAARVRAAIELVHAGDLYQVNVARRIELALALDAGPLAYIELHARLARAAPAPFGITLADEDGAVVGTSPELCLRADPSPDGARFGRLLTEPIKGTRPRGADAESDRALAAELDADEKERAELAMIIDVERNDLHRVSTLRSVRLLGAPRVVTHRTIHHRVARVVGHARPDVDRADVLRAFLPSGSVTGAPKIRAMEVIRTLETHRRGLYTGAYGMLTHDGTLTLAMAIRTCVFGRDGHGEYFTGGGIVADSDAAREVAETHWKARQLGRIAMGRNEQK